jgi:3-hydroxy-9,10-secoandrosta-1,3,5(10)-triene-9,17-dione monooxygenase reductase component
VDGLARQGLVESAATGDPARLRLTESGREALVELAAVAKAAEADAEAGLDFGERQLLKQLLRRVIRDADPRLP